MAAATAAPASSSSRPGRTAMAGDLEERLGRAAPRGTAGGTEGSGPAGEVLGGRRAGAFGGRRGRPAPGAGTGTARGAAALGARVLPAGGRPRRPPRGARHGGGRAAPPPPSPRGGTNRRSSRAAPHGHAWPRSLRTPSAELGGSSRPFWGEKPRHDVAAGLARPSLAYAAAGPARGATPPLAAPPASLPGRPTPEPPEVRPEGARRGPGGLGDPGP